MKTYYAILLQLILILPVAVGQTSQIDSLKRLLVSTGQDTTRVSLLTAIASGYRYFNPDSSIIFVQKALALSEKLNYNIGKVRTLIIYGEARRFRGDFPQALEAQFEALQISKNSRFTEEYEASLGLIGMAYQDLNEYRQALNYLYQAKKLNESVSKKNPGGICRWLSSIGYIYEKMNMLDSALFFQQQAHAYLKNFPVSTIGSLVLTRLGVIQSRLGHPDLALLYFQAALKITYTTGDILNRSRAQYCIAELYYSANQSDSSLNYCHLAFVNGNRVFLKSTILDASNLLVKLYKERNNLDSALHYQEVAMATKELMYGQEKFQQLQLLTLTQQKRQQQLREKQVQLQRIGLISALTVFLLIALVLWRNTRYQKRTNQTLNYKNEQIETQRNTLEKAFTELKGTQAQLIQSEKMASLGELTAGIAHEIQNPLNFVNNFSEVNSELIKELKNEVINKNLDEITSIANDIEANEEKINHHGKRAESIVKGMLQHSQKSVGIKELTDINALADEYFRMAYHSFQSKQKDSPEIKLITDFEGNLPLVNVIPQDIGRVFLNLFNNAFWALSSVALAKEEAVGERGKILFNQSEKQKKQSSDEQEEGSSVRPDQTHLKDETSRPGGPSGGRGTNETYTPLPTKASAQAGTITLTTKSLGDKIEIRVKDNGPGIPQNIIDKIFQPFFTTKPTGQGTGLGLSLAYDIVKSHGGELLVNSQEGEYSEFILRLPGN